MRELKFRFRDHEYKIMSRPNTLGVHVFADGKGDTLGLAENNLNCDEFEDWTEKNNDYSIMQYTGLKDKNGKEIYEGDIIQYKDIRSGREHIYLVYQEGLNWYLGINTDGGHLLENIRHEQTNKKRQEEQNRKQYEDNHPLVIGNIHQTPELL